MLFQKRYHASLQSIKLLTIILDRDVQELASVDQRVAGQCQLPRVTYILQVKVVAGHRDP